MRYDITLTIDGAPGPFDSVGGYMQYEVTNKACVPETGSPMNAMRIAPKAWPPIILHKISDNVYTGAVYADYFKDEDYYRLGVCHWSLLNIVTELKINKLTLDPDLTSDQLFSQSSVKSYFVHQDYLDNDMERSSYGIANPSDYPEIKQEDIFSITLTSKERTR
ncbi:MAG: hypothetical protein WA777_05740 [Rhodanobacter sp.]